MTQIRWSRPLLRLLQNEWDYLKYTHDPGSITLRSQFGSTLDPKTRTGQVIIGSLLGDGHITRSGSFTETHCWAQQELIFELSRLLLPLIQLKDPLLKGWGSSKNRGPLPGVWSYPSQHIPRNHPEDPPRHQFRVGTPALSVFKELRKLWYPFGKKIVPESIPDLIGPQALAWWYLGDGSYPNRSTPKISTMGFNRGENLRLIIALDKNLGILSHLTTNNCIRIDSCSKWDFFDLIRPYIPLTMSYKVGHTPHSLAYCYNPHNYDPEVIIPKTASPDLPFPIEYNPKIIPPFTSWFEDPRILHWLKEVGLDSNRSILIALKNP